MVLSASADMMLASWDADTGGRIRRYLGHEDVINAFDIAKRGPEVMVSASDDGTVGVNHAHFSNSCYGTDSLIRSGIRGKRNVSII